MGLKQYLRGGGFQQLGQGGENRKEQEGFFAVKIFLFAAKQIQQGSLRKKWMYRWGGMFVSGKRHLVRKPHGWERTNSELCYSKRIKSEGENKPNPGSNSSFLFQQ